MTDPPAFQTAPDAAAGSESWLRAVFQHAGLGIALVDMSGHIVESNPALQRMIGYTAGELRELRLGEFTHPEDLPADRDLLRELLRGQRGDYRVENRYLRKDGQTVWGHLTVSLLRDGAGEPEYAIALVEDVTDRKRAEAALVESEAKFRALIENASDLVTVLGADGTILYESPSLERVLGYTPEELVGRSVFELVHPEDWEGIVETFQEVLRAPGTQLSYELRYRHKQGRWIVLHGVGTNLLHDPAVQGIVANSRDVTERSEAEQSVERERAHLEQLFNSSPQGVALVNPEDRVLRINPEFTRLFGYPEEEAVGRTIQELILPEGREDEARSITTRVAQGVRTRTDTVRRRKDGTMVDVAVIGAPVRLHGSEVAVYGIYQDISERKSLEQALRRMSSTDVLTGLLNRRGFLEVAEREWALAARRGGDLLLLYVDLDGFKEINDTFGHAAGDHLLQEVAELLRRSFRATDVLGRIGGDEFVVFAVDALQDTEASLTERVEEAVRRSNEETERPYALSLSVGALRAPAGAPASIGDLLAEADRRMYETKRQRGGSRR